MMVCPSWPISSLEKNTLSKQRKERAISITFFPPCHTIVFSLHLPSDAASQVSETRNRIVVTGRKIDERASFLISPFFLQRTNRPADAIYNAWIRQGEQTVEGDSSCGCWMDSAWRST